MNEIIPNFLPVTILVLPIIVFIFSYIFNKNIKAPLIHFLYSTILAFIIAGSITTDRETTTIDNNQIEITRTKHRVIVEYKTDLLKTFDEKKYYDLLSEDCDYKIKTKYNIFGYVIYKEIWIGCYENDFTPINISI